MGQIGRILYSEECEKCIKELWPDICPECGCVCWIGLMQVSCVNTHCRHGSDKESNKYHDLLAKDEEKHPRLSLPSLSDLYAGKGVWRSHARSYKVNPYDWHDHIETTPCIHDNGQGEWTYQLPPGAARHCMIGDQHVSTANKITYCICKMDRVLDTITICWDNRVPQP